MSRFLFRFSRVIQFATIMSWKAFAVFLIIATPRSETFDVEDMLCTNEFCANYIKEKGCPPLSEACRVQNSTHNGVFLPYPDFCSCCNLCLTNIAENEPCSQGSPGLPVPENICGPGLACTVNEKGLATCQPMVTNCTKAQKDWDNQRDDGTLGATEVRPQCDDDGLFSPVHCIPGSICYCVAPDGGRIFGEIPYLSSWDEHKMTCGCSLNNWKAMKMMNPEFLYETLTVRCNDYGLYDPLQCMMGSKADCLCVDPLTGEPQKDTIVPVSELKPGNPSCFNPSMLSAGVYETECEIRKMEWIEEEEETTTTTTTEASSRVQGRGSRVGIQFVRPECQPDGKYHRVQNYGNKKQICVDPSGNQIEKYEASIGSQMDCNCARTQWLLSKAGVVDLPSCCPQGSFKSWQCRRKECFCVNINGDQMGREVTEKNVATLYCYNNNQPCSATSS